MTINELVARLQDAKRACGGDVDRAVERVLASLREEPLLFLEAIGAWALKALERANLRKEASPAVPVTPGNRKACMAWLPPQTEAHLRWLRAVRGGVDLHIRIFERVLKLQRAAGNVPIQRVLRELPSTERTFVLDFAGVKRLAA